MCDYDSGSDDWEDEQDGSDVYLNGEYDSYDEDNDEDDQVILISACLHSYGNNIQGKNSRIKKSFYDSRSLSSRDNNIKDKNYMESKLCLSWKM